jgi:hypothetical protein
MSTCLVSDADFKKYWPQVGEIVWWIDLSHYRTRQGRLLSYNEDHSIARVRVTGVYTAFKAPLIRTIDASRLKRRP